MSGNSRDASARSGQAAASVLMVRPAAFGWNAETADSNRFQAREPSRDDAASLARVECSALADALTRAGVAVHVCEDLGEPVCPDAVFPNNWVSLHADGTVVLYPMLARNRRSERRLELLLELERDGGYRVHRLLDLTHHELQGRFLEGTGSVVFDHARRVAYACRSPRTDPAVLEELCTELGYVPFLFDAANDDGVPVYHTNVALSIGTGHALLCPDAVPARQRAALLERVAVGRRLIAIDAAQMAEFAGNVLELRARDGRRVLAGSARALASLRIEQRDALAACVDSIVSVPVPTIERLGGGSVRCMLAEVFLPRPGAVPSSRASGESS